ncbi:MAG: glycosyltransferase, partial [Clostridia bacterium]|nr:glycosyltransferase [Clostridia bacterium]
MKKNVWIMNHYAGGSFFNKGGRHYWISKFLKQNGYEPVVFVSNSQNKKSEKIIETSDLFAEKIAEDTGVPYVFVKSKTYSSNGLDRILNMYDFYRNVRKAAKKYAETHGKPDVIYASSVHPLTLVAGQKLAKYFKVKCICEVRDLWPESLVAYGHLKRRSLLAKILYAFEKRIYVKADKVIMTWPGGYDYIKDRGWDKDIPEDKVIHISNGVDLEKYRENVTAHPYTDDELEGSSVKKIIYAGSIREVNNLGMIV